MTGQVQFSADDSRLLKQIVEITRLEQQEVSRRSGVSPGWLSLLLKAQSQRSRTVEGALVQRLTNVLVKELKALQDQHEVSDDRVAWAMDFLSRYTEEAAKLMPPKIYPAGGPIPVDAAHYIKRPTVDSQLISALQIPKFSLMVRGPVQCGKSSLLAQLEHKARAKGIETAWFDPWAAVGSFLDTRKNAGDIFALTATKLVKTLEVEWRLHPPSGRPIEFKEDLSGWLFSELASANRKPRLLILDDLGGLGPIAAEEWLSFVRLIDTKRASRDIQISVAVGMTHHFGPYFARELEGYSSNVSWEPLIELEWLNKKQTAELERRLAGYELNLYELFHGQPYLTHAAVGDADFRESVQHWLENATEKNQRSIIGALPYKRHLRAIRLAILGPPWQDQTSARRLVDSFVHLARGSDSSRDTPTEFSLEWDHEEFLKTAKLMNDARRPELKIYKLIAEEMKDQSFPR